VGGLAVLNLEGVQTRYEDADAVLQKIADTPQAEVTTLLQKLYAAPIKDSLVAARVRAIKQGGVACAASMTPANTKRLAPIALEAGMDILVVQSTVTTATQLAIRDGTGGADDSVHGRSENGELEFVGSYREAEVGLVGVDCDVTWNEGHLIETVGAFHLLEFGILHGPSRG
jgi:hypothetical protein